MLDFFRQLCQNTQVGVMYDVEVVWRTESITQNKGDISYPDYIPYINNQP